MTSSRLARCLINIPFVFRRGGHRDPPLRSAVGFARNLPTERGCTLEQDEALKKVWGGIRFDEN